MKHILVTGLTADNQPWGGIIDIEKNSPSSTELALFVAINEALDAKGTAWAYGEADNEALGVETFEKFPFNGNIEDEVLIYVE